MNGDKVYKVPLLPLRDIVIFPYQTTPLIVGRQRSVNAVKEAIKSNLYIFTTIQRDPKIEDPKEKDVNVVGTLSSIEHHIVESDNIKLLVKGIKRGKIVSYDDRDTYVEVEVKAVENVMKDTLGIEAMRRQLLSAFSEYAKNSNLVAPDIVAYVSSIEDPDVLANAIAGSIKMKVEEKQALLEIPEFDRYMSKLLEKLFGEIEIIDIEKKIKAQVKKQTEKAQKEYYLNEQMRAIQKELGEKDEFKTEIRELEERIKKKKMSDEAQKRCKNELKKLKMMSPMSAEAAVVRSYLEWILCLPWYEYTEEKKDIREAKTILDSDHYGLEQVKERILEFLAVKALSPDAKGPILCFVGPPGVGKTSLARSIAKATGRNFVRQSLGGVRDEAEIRGHRRTYVSALPGKVIQSMRKAGSANPVFLFDEIDKMSMDFRGDPSAALLEVLDPEQNHVFNDHYLDLDYDLSKVMFITTANTVAGIPAALLDRLEIIRLPGYLEIEKLDIARHFLIDKQLKANGLRPQHVVFTDNSIMNLIRDYTREAGVRNLERELSTITRKIAKHILETGNSTRKNIIRGSSLRLYLGVPRYKRSELEERDLVGVATGLAWTEAGGDILAIESVILNGKGKLTVTGNLGESMKESASAALSYVRTISSEIGMEKDFYKNIDIHIHVPEGAIPKDGPSAGITMATSLVSALTKIPVKRDLAMTGEITLRGRVLPIGGLKEKLMAAMRAQIKEVLIPKDNSRDVSEIPETIKKSLSIVLVEHMNEVIERALRVESSALIWKGRGNQGLVEPHMDVAGSLPLPTEQHHPTN
ncbi:MAG: endopeptidase La [Deltaproteobacteria bacterium]|nr:endopeptidase La [Deltaproteobacteria bacterium]